MGYQTEFEGEISIDPSLNPEEIAYLNKFSDSRRMDRTKGPYFVDGVSDYGANKDDDIQDSNKPPEGQPGLWCQWVPTEEGDALVWDGGEKFYCSLEWMGYLIKHFLKPNPIAKALHPDKFSFLQGHTLNGTITAQGECASDIWKLVVENNYVRQVQGKIVFEE
jgi:hypothetical protein